MPVLQSLEELWITDVELDQTNLFDFVKYQVIENAPNLKSLVIINIDNNQLDLLSQYTYMKHLDHLIYRGVHQLTQLERLTLRPPKFKI